MLRTRRPSRAPATLVDAAPMNIYRRPTNLGRVEQTATQRPYRPIAPAPAPVPNRPNNVFAGRDGKIYQRDDRGNWKVNEGRGWNPTPVPNQPRATPKPPSPAPGTSPFSGWPKARPPVERQPVTPSAPRAQPPPQPKPAAPALRPDPGDLEREFRARQRSGAGVTPGAVRPAKQEPQKPAGKKEKKE